MNKLGAIVFCLICVGHAHTMWANGSTHHNNTTGDVDVDVRAEGGRGGNAYAEGGRGGNSVSGSYSYSGSDVNIKGDDVEAAASSASVYLSGCQQGVAAQGLAFGASAGAESRVCQLLRLAAAHQALGQPFEAMRLVRQATEEVNGGGYTPSEAPPLARASRWFRRNVTAPLFGWLPFVGHSV